MTFDTNEKYNMLQHHVTSFCNLIKVYDKGSSCIDIAIICFS